MGHIIAIFHHGGRIYKGQYVSKLGNIVFSIDKDHFSLTELKSYAKDIGYDEVDAFFTEDPITHNFVKGSTATPTLGPFSVENNNQELGNCSRVSHTEHGINGEGGVEQPLDEENDDSLNFEEDDLDDVPDQDDSEVDEELRTFREKLREDKKNEAAKQKKRTKKLSKDQGVELGEVGIDKGFENIFTNKATKFNGKLGGDEVFIDSSDEPSEDSDEELDVLAQPVEPPEVKPMPGRPGRCRRKDKDEPRKKKWGKASKNGVKMSCSKCHQVGHNKRTCKSVVRISVFLILQRLKEGKKKQPTARATSSSTAWTSSSSVGMPPPSSVGMPPAPSVGRKRTRDVGFGVYTDIQTGRQVINPGRSSERVISSGTGIAFKDASQTNVDLGFKPPGLKWKGKNAMTRNQLQQLSKKKVQSKSKGKWVS
ncbi:hypothetical protein H5410_053374 [Solanum commersonii]|uniref:Uncharacterized protein n=1 Tax=Solanum commersonii TaxID=4109 RepID=A0A9J5X3N9_SOLCO|nr:hypothetical protein H5410_053374 [Solanum commersonii]